MVTMDDSTPPARKIPLHLQAISFPFGLLAVLGLSALFAPELAYRPLTEAVPVLATMPQLPWVLIVVGLAVSIGVQGSWAVKHLLPKTRRR